MKMFVVMGTIINEDLCIFKKQTTKSVQKVMLFFLKFLFIPLHFTFDQKLNLMLSLLKIDILFFL